MENPTNTRLVSYKDPVTGERVTVPENEAPSLRVAISGANEAQAEPTPVSPQSPVKAAQNRAYNPDGEFVVMDRSYYRGQAGINTYSNTVSYAGAIWFIEELSGADFNTFKAKLKELSFEVKSQQQARAERRAELGGPEDLDEGDEWVQITQRKTQIHREVIEAAVRGCTDPHLATKAGRDSLYQKSIEELAALIISASLLGKDGADFLPG